MIHETYRVRDNCEFWVAMEEAFNEHPLELNQTPAFWELTWRAHEDPSPCGWGVTELDSARAVVSEDDPIVAKLLLVRNEYLAHRGTRHVTRGTFEALPNLQSDEITTLINGALSLLTKYRDRLGYPPLGPAGGGGISTVAVDYSGGGATWEHSSVKA